MITKTNSTVTFNCGITMKNRFMLAPLTNQQSHDNGQLSEDEFNWLTMRAKGGFGLVMTCASHVQEIGKGFFGQLGIFNDSLNEGHIKLAKSIKTYGSLAVIQLHHAGMRTPSELINERSVCPSENEKTNSRALNLEEVYELRTSFITAAVRAKKCGYDGVEIHGAHGYILTQFLSSEINKRTDQYGGSLLNRARLLFEIVTGIREQCGADFLVGVRLSPERFAMDIDEIKWVSQQLIDQGNIDFLDISLWDCFKIPNDKKYQESTLLEHFTSLDFKKVKWTVAGKISNAVDVQKILDAGVDFVSIGTSGILHHDFPKLVIENPTFNPVSLPVSAEYLRKEGVSDTFIEYLKKRAGFVE
ncbi:NADH:flavin oxidoreductase [Tenacibaculum piscium]|uniref:NADH:flavin oxidoreductase n=2 Tax=Tenacibaculum piscium TaxID=1458515 RepID=A0A2H1YFZ4_9FLAO|nr:NADH:flavin oxidoreductase [Tenacibaculum piscium]SOS74350.1 NADH:flavin oxidoreductase [Tenacibaculum piscium]